MKYFLYFILVFNVLGFSEVHSQANRYFENNPVWTVSTDCAIPYPCIQHDISNYFIQGDSLINNLVYKKIFKKGQGYLSSLSLPGGTCSGSYSYIDTVPEFLLRSLDKKMYVRMNNDTSEHLLYDFELAIGDTLPPTYHYNLNDIYVVEIDSIYTANGYLKKFKLGGANAAVYLLEGIGNSNGLLEPYYSVFDCGFGLSCYSLNDTAYFPQNGPSCELSIGIDELVAPEKISVFPNPSAGFTSLYINSSLKNANLKIFNSLGELVDELIWSHGSTLRLKTDKLANGVYYLNIQQENKVIAKGKLLILKN